VGERRTHDLVDELAGLAQTRIHNLPKHAPVLPATEHEPVALQDGEVLGDVGAAHLEQLGELARRLGAVAEVMHELVARGVGERREHRGVDRVTLSVIIHGSIIAKFRNFATWQLLRQ
jgi:hypothetical protein